MAVNCKCVPIVSEGFVGIKVIDTNTGPGAVVTVMTVVPLIVPWPAVIVVVPEVTAVARPCLPAALLIVATAVMLDVHVTVLVRSRVLPPVNVPVALNCSVLPAEIEGLAGVTKMEISTLVESDTVAAGAEPAASSERHNQPASNTRVQERSLLIVELRQEFEEEKLDGELMATSATDRKPGRPIPSLGGKLASRVAFSGNGTVAHDLQCRSSEESAP